MHDNDTAGIGDSPATPAMAAPQDMRPGAPQRLDVRFTGSGSEYFRIWLVNLLLTIVTLGFYHPFAKARKLAYFHGNTLVGDQPLGFHGDPWKMLRGYLLMLLFGVVYGVSSRFAPAVAVVAIAAFALLWPALWRASLQFRLGNTSWRGLRFGFDGSLGGAYLSMLPAVLPWAAMVGLAVLAPQPGAEGGAVAPPGGAFMAAFFGVFASFFLVMPLALAWVKRYQHGHYVYAGQRSRLDAGVGAFYAYALKLFGVSLLVMLVGGIVMGVTMAVTFASAAATEGKSAVMAVGMALAGIAFYGAYFVVVMPYGQSRLQNLVWGRTRSDALQCRSDLHMWPLGWLTLKNLVLCILTLGLYWPFAAMATTRLRLQAMAVELDGDIGQWAATAGGTTQDATGDAAGDFFGIDLGL
ncbi:MAG: YjgN family protein [Burkholderiaceae bacterium]